MFSFKRKFKRLLKPFMQIDRNTPLWNKLFNTSNKNKFKHTGCWFTWTFFSFAIFLLYFSWFGNLDKCIFESTCKVSETRNLLLHNYYFWNYEIWIFALIQQEAKHGQEKISAEQKWKAWWQSPAMFCLFTHQAKIQICCTVKLIPWNVVNLSHL